MVMEQTTPNTLPSSCGVVRVAGPALSASHAVIYLCLLVEVVAVRLFILVGAPEYFCLLISTEANHMKIDEILTIEWC